MTIKTQDNGYKAEAIQEMIAIFNTAAQAVFGDCEVEHFYYGDGLSMAAIRLPNGNYGHYNITANRVSLTGYTASCENYTKMTTLTYRDECYRGYLREIAKEATA